MCESRPGGVEGDKEVITNDIIHDPALRRGNFHDKRRDGGQRGAQAIRVQSLRRRVELANVQAQQ